jgi:hypothetical protein
MAHGTPLATGGSDQHCGVPGAFLLEVGISSSYHIAKFWGLTRLPRKLSRIFDGWRRSPCSKAPANLAGGRNSAADVKLARQSGASRSSHNPSLARAALIRLVNRLRIHLSL